MHTYTGTSLARLEALINTDNATNYQIGVEFTLGPPEAYVGTDFRNTQCVAIPTNPNTEAQTLTWRRLSLSLLNELEDVAPVQIPHLPFTIHEILPQINAALNLELTEEEVVNTRYEDYQSYYRLQIAGPHASYAWLESGYTFVADHGIEGQRYEESQYPRFNEDGSLRFIEALET